MAVIDWFSLKENEDGRVARHQVCKYVKSSIMNATILQCLSFCASWSFRYYIDSLYCDLSDNYLLGLLSSNSLSRKTHNKANWTVVQICTSIEHVVLSFSSKKLAIAWRLKAESTWRTQFSSKKPWDRWYAWGKCSQFSSCACGLMGDFPPTHTQCPSKTVLQIRQHRFVCLFSYCFNALLLASRTKSGCIEQTTKFFLTMFFSGKKCSISVLSCQLC